MRRGIRERQLRGLAREMRACRETIVFRIQCVPANDRSILIGEKAQAQLLWQKPAIMANI